MIVACRRLLLRSLGDRLAFRYRDFGSVLVAAGAGYGVMTSADCFPGPLQAGHGCAHD